MARPPRNIDVTSRALRFGEVEFTSQDLDLRLSDLIGPTTNSTLTLDGGSYEDLNVPLWLLAGDSLAENPVDRFFGADIQGLQTGASEGSAPDVSNKFMLGGASDVNLPRYKGLTLPERIEKAGEAVGDELSELCTDPSPIVIGMVLRNVSVGLVQARLIAQHHNTAIGLGLLARNFYFVRDTIVQAFLLKNPVVPKYVLDRVLDSKSLIDLYNLLMGSETTEEVKAEARIKIGVKFRNSSASECAGFIIRTEGRCLQFLYHERLTKDIVDELCARISEFTATLLEKLKIFPGLPPVLIAKILSHPSLVRKGSELEKVFTHNPNCPAYAAKKRGVER